MVGEATRVERARAAKTGGAVTDNAAKVDVANATMVAGQRVAATNEATSVVTKIEIEAEDDGIDQAPDHDSNHPFKKCLSVATKFWYKSLKKGLAPRALRFQPTLAFQVAIWC